MSLVSPLSSSFVSLRFRASPFVSLASALVMSALPGARRPRGRSYGAHLLVSLAWLPPLYYLYAWAGHLVLQADVPAVFTYGTTLRGWASGELCSIGELLGGETVRTPLELATTAVLCAAHLAVLPPGVSLRRAEVKRKVPLASRVRERLAEKQRLAEEKARRQQRSTA